MRGREPVFINPISDWGFHRLFGTPSNSRLLKYLLNTIIDDRNIVEVELREPKHFYMTAEKGYSVFDVYCTCDDGSRIIVEMQKGNEGNFLDRAFAYSSMAVMDQAKQSWDYRLDKLYFIGILNFDMFKGEKKYITRVMLSDIDKYGKIIYPNYLQIYIELPKFVADDSELNDARDALLFLLKNLGEMDSVPEWVSGHDEEIKLICEGAQFKNLSENEKKEYIMSEDEQLRWERIVQHNREEGRAEGLAEGLAEGKSAKQNEIARNLLAMGMSEEDISKVTGLSCEEVAEL